MDEWVTSYLVQISTDGGSYSPVPGTFVGNTDRTTRVERCFLTIVQARYVRVLPQSWSGSIAMRCAVLAHDAFQERNPSEHARMYSSILRDSPIGTGYARSALDSTAAWVPYPSRQGEWLQLDLGKVFNVAGVVTQGGGGGHWVTSYLVQIGIDGGNFSPVPGTFAGNTDGTMRVERWFPTIVQARYVRILPQEWSNFISMRCGVLACDAFQEQNPSENARGYSSICSGSTIGTGLARSALDSQQAWKACQNQPGEWLQLDLGKVFNVTGVVTQGRRDMDEWVTSYCVSTSIDDDDDGDYFDPVPGTFVGNTDRTTRVESCFPIIVQARYVRILPQVWAGSIAMRCGVLAQAD